MSTSRLLSLAGAIAGAALVLAPIRAVQAQASNGSGLSIEGFATHYWFDAGEGNPRTEQNGGGVRFMIHSPQENLTGESGFARWSLGAFVVLTPKENGVSTMHYGGEMDAQLLSRPMDDVLDPFIGVGAGGFRTELSSFGGTLSSTNTDFALSPAIGTYLHLHPIISLRFDLRDVIVFGQSRTAQHYELSGGVSVGF